jgi:hypothetical protein
MRASDIIDFLLARLGEDERDTALFHEFTCLTLSGAAAAPAGPADRQPRCECPVPRHLLDQIWIRRQIIRAAEEQIHQAQQSPEQPDGLIEALQILGALTLAYELHPSWRERWPP